MALNDNTIWLIVQNSHYSYFHNLLSWVDRRWGPTSLWIKAGIIYSSYSYSINSSLWRELSSGGTYWHTFYMASFNTELQQHIRPFEIYAQLFGGEMKIWWAEFIQISLFLASFLSDCFTHTQATNKRLQRKVSRKMFEFQININSSLAWNKVSCVSICPLIGGIVCLCCTMQHTLGGCRHQTAGCVQCVSAAPHSSMPQCVVMELCSAVGPMRAKWVTSPIKSS